MAATPRVVKLTLINDLICTHCAIQQHELLEAMDHVKNTLDLPLEFEIQHVPFKLISDNCWNDSMPKMEKRQFYETKLGAEKFAYVANVVETWGREKGVAISFSGPMCQSTLGHRLSLKVYRLAGEKKQTELLSALFKAHMEEAKDISDVDVLSDIAADTGVMTKEEAIEFLKSDELEKDLNDTFEKLRAKGIQGVPVTIIDGKWAVNGGQSAEVFIQIFKKLAAGGAHTIAAPSADSAFANPCPSTGEPIRACKAMH